MVPRNKGLEFRARPKGPGKEINHLGRIPKIPPGSLVASTAVAISFLRLHILVLLVEPGIGVPEAVHQVSPD